METMSVEAASRESVLGLHQALAGYRADLREPDGGPPCIEIEMRGSDRELVEVLNAIEEYITQRSCGPARLMLNGRKYTLHAR